MIGALQAWKKEAGPIGRGSEKYLPDPRPEDMPKSSAQPEFKVLRYDTTSGLLSIPIDVRRRYLEDPLRSPEWRDVLGKFDRIYNVPATRLQRAPSAAEPQPINEGGPFKDEPLAIAALETKYPKTVVSFDLGNMPCFVTIVDDAGNFKCFIVCKDQECHVDRRAYLFSHGVGSWLQDEKASKFMKEAGEAMTKRLIPCTFLSDKAMVVEETNFDGSRSEDTAPMPLRQFLQGLEEKGNVDFSFAGHTIERPPGVQQGIEPDKCPKIPSKFALTHSQGGLFSHCTLGLSPLRGPC
jgi:hypothetical protein